MRSVSNPVPWQILLTVARGKSLSEAADLHGVDSGMGSRLISALEKELGIELLDRATKPVKPSEGAYRLLPRVMEYLDRYEALLVEAEAQKNDKSQPSVIRLSVPGNIPRLVVIDLEEEYRRSHPDVVFEVFSGCEHSDILAGRIDIAALPYRPQDDRLHCVPLSRTTTFLAASPAYLAATGRIRAMDRPDAASVPVIAMTANAFAEDRIAAKQAGMSEHLAKPMDVQRVIKTVWQCVGERRKAD